MPRRRDYALFICHDWEYNADYYRICEFLDQEPHFQWTNLSVPEHDPLDTDEMLEKNLRDQIRPADVMVIVAGMEAARSEWMDWEIRFARRIGTPIVGVRRWGAIQIPKLVQRNATEIVGWNRDSIVNSIRYYAR